jgi:hypothetical protein
MVELRSERPSKGSVGRSCLVAKKMERRDQRQGILGE